MATIYVDSNAGGSNDGTSWANAFTSIASADGAGSAAGDTVLVAHNHSENFSATTTLDFSNSTEANPINIISANSGTSAYQAGASISAGTGATQLTIKGWTNWEGVSLATGAYFAVGDPIESLSFRSCTFTILTLNGTSFSFFNGVSTLAYVSTRLLFSGCTFDWSVRDPSSASLFNFIGGSSQIHIVGCSFTSGGDWGSGIFRTYASGTYPHLPRMFVDSCDLSFQGSSVILGSDYGEVILRRCRLGTSYSLAGTIGNRWTRVIAENCAAGTISAPPLGMTASKSYQGSCAASLSVYRTGGATDGEQANPYSFGMTTGTTAKELFSSLELPSPIAKWVEAGSQTLTIYVAAAATLNDDDFWIEVNSPNETASPSTVATGRFQTKRGTPLATPTALTTDGTSSWTAPGSEADVKHRIDVTIDPELPGPVTIRCFLAKPSTTVYVDPKIEVA